MIFFLDKEKRQYLLLPDVWRHIIEGHPEIEKYYSKIEETLFNPEIICQSKKFEACRLYYKKLKENLFFVVVVDVFKEIIKTSYLTDRIKGGTLIWPEKN